MRTFTSKGQHSWALRAMDDKFKWMGGWEAHTEQLENDRWHEWTKIVQLGLK